MKGLISSLMRVHILAQLGWYGYNFFFEEVLWREFNDVYKLSLIVLGVYLALVIVLEPFASPAPTKKLEVTHKVEPYEKITDNQISSDKIPTIVDLKPSKKSRKGLFLTIFIIFIIFTIISYAG